MQIIVVDRQLPRAIALNLTFRGAIVAAVGLALTVLLAVVGLYAATFRLATEVRIPVVRDAIAFILHDDLARSDQVLRDQVSAMARKLGEMQAQMLRLDSLGERVSKIVGISPEEFRFQDAPGRGGPTTHGEPLSLEELRLELERASSALALRSDFLDVVEQELMQTRMRRALLPQNTPVTEGFVGSPFGMRIDPFTGERSMHSGLDFAAPTGTPIYAAAGGVVANVEFHPAFGRMVDIDHGNELMTRYAHASRVDVKLGDIVRMGQKIAEVGSTGRSTGSHLHFEVHLRGEVQNPARFLAQKSDALFVASQAGPTARAVDVEGLARAKSARR